MVPSLPSSKAGGARLVTTPISTRCTRRALARRRGGNRRRDRALAAVSVSRVFQCVRGSDHARTGEQVRGYLDEAMSAYGRILGWPEHPACALWRCRTASADLDAHVLTNVQFIDPPAGRAGISRGVGTRAPRAGMIRSALATASRDDGLLGRQVQTVSLRAILDRGGLGVDGDENPAAVATLQLERFVPDRTNAVENNNAPGFFTGFFPDPVSLGCVVLDEGFRWSLIDAWALAGKDFNGRGWVRWRLLGLGCAPHIGGGSLVRSLPWDCAG